MLLKVQAIWELTVIYISLRLPQWEVMQRLRRLTAKPEKIGNSCFPQGFDYPRIGELNQETRPSSS